MEGQAIIQVLLICVLLGYGAGITTAFMVLNTGSRGYSSSPVVVESHDSTGCAFGLLALLGLGALLVVALILSLLR
jgi:hypothetical protein